MQRYKNVISLIEKILFTSYYNFIMGKRKNPTPCWAAIAFELTFSKWEKNLKLNLLLTPIFRNSFSATWHVPNWFFFVGNLIWQSHLPTSTWARAWPMRPAEDAEGKQNPFHHIFLGWPLPKKENPRWSRSHPPATLRLSTFSSPFSSRFLYATCAKSIHKVNLHTHPFQVLGYIYRFVL